MGQSPSESRDFAFSRFLKPIQVKDRARPKKSINMSDSMYPGRFDVPSARFDAPSARFKGRERLWQSQLWEGGGMLRYSSTCLKRHYLYSDDVE